MWARTGELVHCCEDGGGADCQATQLRQQDAALRCQPLDDWQHQLAVRVSHTARRGANASLDLGALAAKTMQKLRSAAFPAEGPS